MYRLLVTVSILVFAAGAGLFALGLQARSRLDPSSIEWDGTRFRIVRRSDAASQSFDLLRADGTVAASVAGSTDTMCDPPYLMVLDVDGDGTRDVYYHGCGGHGYLELQGGMLKEVDLGQQDPADAPALRSLWAREIRAGGVRLIIAGVILGLAGLIGVLVFAPRRAR